MINHDAKSFYERTLNKPFDDSFIFKSLLQDEYIWKNKVWLAGGSIRRELLSEPPADYDFFFKEQGLVDAFENFLFSLGYTKTKETVHHRQFEKGDIKIQAIYFRFYQTPVDIIESFDFTICQMVFDGDNFYFGDYTLWDAANRQLQVNKITYPISSTRRMMKYTSQGYTATNQAIKALMDSSYNQDEMEYVG